MCLQVNKSGPVVRTMVAELNVQRTFRLCAQNRVGQTFVVTLNMRLERRVKIMEGPEYVVSNHLVPKCKSVTRIHPLIRNQQ